MVGFEAAWSGRSLAWLPPELVEALARYGGQSMTLGLRQGKPDALAQALHSLADERGDRAGKLQVLQVLGEVRPPGCVPVLLRLACQSSDNALRTAALTALGGFEDPVIPVDVLKAYAGMSDDVAAAAQGLLVARRAWAAQFLAAVDSHSIDSHT